jgi:hypothetical protein
MGYNTPHDARDFFKAAAMFTCHQVILRCQRRPTPKLRRQELDEIREIDLCAMTASHFGSSAHLAAQGTDGVDIDIFSPTLRAEVKYPHGSQAYSSFKKDKNGVKRQVGVRRDWDTLLTKTNTGDEFRKFAWIVFWPSVKYYAFTDRLSVGKRSKHYSREEYAPFLPCAVPAGRRNGEKLVWAAPALREYKLSLAGGKAVQVDIVGSPEHDLWAMVYTRTVFPRPEMDDIANGIFKID